MLTTARLRVARGERGKNPDALVLACDARGLTLRMLAERVGCSHSLLSQARRGALSIRRELAERIEDLIGFAASSKNWPKIAG